MQGNQGIGRLELLGFEEKRRILEEWNDTAREVPETTLPRLFEEQVERTPEAVAVVYEQEHLTYRELNERANRVGHLLIAEGVGREDVVGLAVPRSLEMIVGLLGILKAGAAYLPMDMEYPVERLAYMLEDAGPVRVITTREGREKLPGGVGQIVLDEAETVEVLEGRAGSNPRDAERKRPLHLQNPAYVIYTSGSTGKPKGVVVSHGALCAFFHAIIQHSSFHLGQRHIAITTATFDISILEFLVPLCQGAEILIATK